MFKAQTKYQIIQYDDTVKKEGSVELANGSIVTYDNRTHEYWTTLESGTKVYADNLEELIQKTTETQLCSTPIL